MSDPVAEFMDEVDAEVTRRITDAYLRYTENLKDTLDPETYVVQMTDWQQVAEQLTGELNEELADIVEAAGTRMWKGPSGTAFTLQNPYTPQWLTEHAFSRVSAIQAVNADALGQLRQRIAAGVMSGETRKAISKYVGASLGLGPRDVLMVERFRELNGAVAATEYAAQKLRERAERIARTELVSASNHGAITSWKVARNEGYVPSRSQKRWIAGRDERMCPTCGAMDGRRVGLDEGFLLPDGTIVDGPTAHPNCRCSTALVTDLPKNWKVPSDSFTVGGFLAAHRDRRAKVADAARRATQARRK